MSPEAYMYMKTDMIFDQLEEMGFLTEDENGILELADLEVDNNSLNSGFDATSMAIMALRMGAADLNRRFNTKASVPVFMKINPDNYIANLENSIKKAKEQIAQADFSQLDEMCDFSDMTDEEKEEYNVYMQPEMIAKDIAEFLPDIIEGQEAMLEQFKTTKKSDLVQVLKEVSNATNKMLYAVVQNGFAGNARGVVACLSSDIELISTPEIIDNENGTVTYVYTDMLLNKTEVVRNKANGDYISAKSQNAGGVVMYDVEFNADGTIKKLDFVNNTDNSHVLLSQDKNNLAVKQIFNNVATERHFIKQDDENLKQTSMRIYIVSDAL